MSSQTPGRARVLGIGSPKGGVGKTQTAVTPAHLASRAGYRVLLVDADENLSAENCVMRAGDRIDVDVAVERDARNLVRLHDLPGLDLVVVDVPGARTSGAWTALLHGAAGTPVVDALVVPSLVDTMDLRAVTRVIRGAVLPAGVPYLLVGTKVRTPRRRVRRPPAPAPPRSRDRPATAHATSARSTPRTPANAARASAPTPNPRAGRSSARSAAAPDEPPARSMPSWSSSSLADTKWKGLSLLQSGVMANSYKSRRAYDATPEVVFSALRDLVSSKDLKVEFEDPDLAVLEVTTGVSFKSWGERLYITTSPDAGGSGTVVDVDSRSKFAMVDWGKNQDNVEGLLDELTGAVA